MLKKVSLMVVALLAIAPLANAALEFRVDGVTVDSGYSGPGSTVEIFMDYTGTDFYTAIVSDGTFTLTPTLGNMPDASGEVLSSIFVDDGAGGLVPAVSGVDAGFDGPVWTIAAYSTGVTKPLALFFTVSDIQGSTIQVLNVDGDMQGTVAGQVTIPEPATLALLGLGGLLLRKRK